MKQNNLSYKKLIEKGIFPAVLLFWPLINVNQGINLADTTYSLGNYMFFNEMTGSWKYATYIANLLGYVFSRICGSEMLLMNLVTGLIVSLTGLFVYYSMRNEIKSAVLFLSLLLAESLCWCPTVILYNYLTYFLLTAGAVLIYKAVTNNNKSLYFIAGLVLGINLFVRISNAVEVVLIAAVWLGIVLYKGNNKKAKWLKPSLLCIAGYMTSFVFIFIFIVFNSGTDGIKEAFEWLINLFTSSEDSGGYSASVMIKTIWDNYLLYIKWFLIMIAGIIIGFAGFNTLKDRFLWVKRIGYMVAVLLMFIYFYRNGVFNFYYRNTGAIFGLSVIFIIFQYLILLYTAINSETERNHKLLAYIAVIILLITPLGSNNHLFTLINNMFFTMPVSVWLFINLVKPFVKEQIAYPLISMLSVFALIYFMQALIFHVEYVFHDGENGEEREWVINADCPVRSMKTTKKQAEYINELVKFKETGNISDCQGIITYGNIAGISYILEMPNSISSSWPDLDSYSIENFKSDLNAVKIKDCVFIDNEVLKDYLENNSSKNNNSGNNNHENSENSNSENSNSENSNSENSNSENSDLENSNSENEKLELLINYIGKYKNIYETEYFTVFY